MSSLIYTYSNNEELKFINDNCSLKVCSLNFQFDECYDYIDITWIIQYISNNQNTVILLPIEDYLNINYDVIIHENFVDIALNLYPTLFYGSEKLSEKEVALKNIKEPEIINKKTLYYYDVSKKDQLVNFFNKNNIQFIDLDSLILLEKFKNIKFNKEIIVDISNFQNELSHLDFFIKLLDSFNIIYICNNLDNNNLSYYFKDKIDISERFKDFKLDITSNNQVLKFTDLDYDDFYLLEEYLFNNLIGHNKFKEHLIKNLTDFRILNSLRLKKVFSIFLLGNSGLGKTEVARILNNFLNENLQLIKINFGNYSSMDSLNSLIGSPRGFVGSEDGELSIKLNKNHNGIILCDEFEKADSKIKSFFLELLEEGKFTDSQSNEYDLDGYIIIFTSNLNKESFTEELSDEFISRLDLKSEFNYLSCDEKNQFISLEIEKIKKTINNKEEFKDIDLSNFKLNLNVNRMNNLRDIQRVIYKQIIDFLMSDIK